jgi:hypothetical protein
MYRELSQSGQGPITSCGYKQPLIRGRTRQQRSFGIGLQETVYALDAMTIGRALPTGLRKTVP